MSSAYKERINAWLSQLCECCRMRSSSQLHHKFSQTKWAKRLYGDLIHSTVNIQFACNGCHASHASPNLVHWSEKEFCEALGIECRSKVETMKGKL